MTYLKNLRWEMLAFSILSIVFGTLMFLYPSKIMTAVCVVLASILFVFGIRSIIEYRRRDAISNFYKYELVLGIVFIVLGIVVLTQMDAILSFVTYIIGIIVLISGLMKVENAIDLKKMGVTWVPLLVFAIICILLGISVLTMPMNHNDNGTKTAGDFFVQCAGAIFAANGLIDLVTTLLVSGKIKIWTVERNAMERSQKIDDVVIDIDYGEINEEE